MTWTIIFKQNTTLLSKVFIGPHDSNMARKQIMGTLYKSDSEFVALIRGEHEPIFQAQERRA